ncbi:ATP:cob(I)alamin adenosyltransferase, partial [Desulfobacteraceae bacterium SEEP-SAG9]
MKDAEQVEAYGDIDELNSLLGLLVSVLPQSALCLSDEVEQIQNSLFKIGALVATELDSSLL